MKHVTSIHISLLVVASIALSACAPAAAPVPAVEAPAAEAPAAGAPPEDITIVDLSLSDFPIERWIPEADLMRTKLEEKVHQALVQEANHAEKPQNDQNDNMFTRGHKALIIMAENTYDSLERISDAVQAHLENSYLFRLMGL